MYKTSPREPLQQLSSFSRDEDGDIVATNEILKAGVSIKWNRKRVLAFKKQLENGKLEEMETLCQLYISNKIFGFRCQQKETYFLLGPLVKEFMFLAKSIKDKTSNQLETKIDNENITEPKFLENTEIRYKELIKVFDKFAALMLFIDEKRLNEVPSKIQYLFIKD